MMNTEGSEGSSGKDKRRRHKPSGFEEWGGYMAAKKQKLNAQFEEQKAVQLDDWTTTQIFKGVSIFVNGYTKPPADQLKKLMLMHGGQYHHYYSFSKTTHVIASNLPNSKMKDLRSRTVVTADWITDSIKAGKLLNYHKYLLYTPEVVDKQQRLQIETFQGTKSETSTNNQNKCPSLEGKIMSTKTPNIVNETQLASGCHLESKVNVQNCLTTTDSSLSSFESHPNTCVSPQKSSVAVHAGHPEFLTEFYNHSRLHHISTAGQELKRYVQYMAENNKDRHFPSRDQLRNLRQDNLTFLNDPSFDLCQNQEVKNKARSIIMHLDMDCFFVSVGLKKHPELKGVPVAVTHSKGKRGGPQEGSDIHYEAAHYANESQKKIGGLASNKGNETSNVSIEKPKISLHSKEYGSLSEIASCSYEARRAGVRNGMFLGEALRRCPNLKTIPYDFEGYSEVSKQLYNIVASYTLDIEAVSCDELYLDCTELLQDVQLSAYQFASLLRAEIEEKTGCTASAGMGPNMLLARLANRVAKPNGQHYVCDSDIEEFMRKQSVGDLPGVGYSTSKKLEQLKVITCEDLQAWPLSKLQQEFGSKKGQSLFNRCRGKDDRSVQFQKERKSVSAEINYGIRFETEDDVYKFINELSTEVQNRLQNINCKGKSLTLKLMVRRSNAPVETAKFMGHGVCDSLSKSIALKSATDSAKVIGNECCILARSLKIKPQDYRGVGVQMSKLEPIQKEGKTSNIMKNFLCLNNNGSTSKSELGNEQRDGSFATKNAAAVDRNFPEKGTIDHFLSKQYTSADYLHGQPSQSFLDALPEDLKNEVVESCCGIAASKATISSLPSCSNLQSCTSSSLLKQDLSETAMHNLEQFDLSVLNALPEDLRKEVLASCGVPVKPPLPSISHQSASTEPQSSKSASGVKKGYNVLKLSDTNQLTIEFYSSKPVLEKKCNEESIKKKKANLGGAVEIDDIRKSLKEWIQSTREPLEEDVDALKNFLLEAIDDDLYKTNLVLKYMYRLAKSTSDEWKEVYLRVLSHVQQKVRQIYGAKLDVSSDFPT